MAWISEVRLLGLANVMVLVAIRALPLRENNLNRRNDGALSSRRPLNRPFWVESLNSGLSGKVMHNTPFGGGSDRPTFGAAAYTCVLERK